MAGKLTVDLKDLKCGNMKNSNSVKVYSSKSILSYQNGSASVAEAGVCDVMESSLDKMPEKQRFPDFPCCNHENLSNECLDLLRKKLISDLSLQVFCTDLENKIIKMEPMEISKERLTVIQKLLVQISQLSDAEKLLLYLKLQSSTSSRADPLRQPLNPLGNRQEIQQTIVWIKTHLEEDRDISIPKQDVYDQYLKYCENVSMKPLSTADFGKVMKQVYPGVRPRRLGTRGNSRYCYSGMRNTLKLPVPSLPHFVTESNLSNGNLVNGSDSVAHEYEKTKKIEKSKRKWKSSTGRNLRISSATRLQKPISKDMSLKCPKRLKVEDSSETGSAVIYKVSDVSQCQVKSENLRVQQEIGSEESINALGNILANDLGLCFENEDGSFKNSEIKEKGNLNILNKMDLENEELRQKLNGMSNTNVNESKEISAGEGVERILLETNSRILEKSVGLSHVKEKNEADAGIMSERNDLKSHKLKGRKPNLFSKSQRNLTKTYVPIQPKPMNNPKPKVHFESDYSTIVGSRRISGKMDCDAPYCEESDSQEPEEEIVRYFRHLEENRFLGASGKVNRSVQIKCNSLKRILTPDEGRSRSCFEDQLRMSKPLEPARKCNLLQRSQSSVEFTGEQPKKPEYEMNRGTCDRDKISHLRLLLENSITTDKCVSGQNVETEFVSVSRVRATCSPRSNCSPCLANPSSSNAPIDRNLPKLDGQKVPQSPNISSRYFSFTPISPGSQSPLKTPSSPFVSPRDTPISRSRQNSFQNDHFFPPTKSTDIARSVALDSTDFGNENGLILSKGIGSRKPDRLTKESASDNNFSEFQKSLLSIRPRSNSSTNFYRAKAKRNLSKVLSCDRVSFKEPNQSCEIFSNLNFTGNTASPYPLINQNIVMSDSLSSEIRQLFENDSRIQEAQCATSRSQSVPLNRMISEGSWFSQQASPIYNQCLNTEASDERTQQNSGDYGGFEPKSLDSFIPNEQMSLDGMNEVFARENHDISYQIFDGNFDSGNSDNNNDNNFSQNNNFTSDACFPSKIELTVNPFPGAFPSEPDGMKPYLSNFGTPIEKESSSEDKANLKLFNNSLYDGSGESAKDPVITSFKPVFMGEFSSRPNSPVLGFFGPKGNDENQLIEFLGLDS